MDIDKLTDFLYSSNTTENVPFRLALVSGQYAEFDLTKQQCKKLLKFLSNSKNYNKENFDKFLKDNIYEDGENDNI